MSNGYRSLGIAALAAALFIAFGLGAYWTGLPYPQERYQPYQNSDKVENGAAATISNVAASVVERTPCNNPKSETESDLCAQWRAAKAAEKSADWTVYSFWATLIGIALLSWQIILTREAVEDTGRATVAMQEANDIARKNTVIAEGERFDRLRAYVHADRATFAELEAGNPPRIFEIQWRNYGATPALKTVCIACVRIIEPNGSIADAISDVPPLEKAHGRAVVQGRHTTAWTLPIHHETFMNAIQGRQRIIILSRVEYEDAIAGHRHVTQEVWEIKLTQTSPIDARGDFSVAIQELHVPQFQIAT